MLDETIPEDQDFRYPLFNSPLIYTYQVRTAASQNAQTFSAPHEILINMKYFTDDDTVVFQTPNNRADLYIISIKTFRELAISGVVRATDDELEILWMRLLLTNWYSKRIIDKGVILQLDHIFRRFLTGIKGGYDHYIASTARGKVLYFKHRRMNSIHMLAMIKSLNYLNDIHSNYIQVPFNVMKRGLIYECLRADPYTAQFSLNSYEISVEDNIQETDTRSEFIRIINHLIAS